MAWIDLPDGRKACERHAESFDRGQTCASCATDPGPSIAIENAEREHDDELIRREGELYTMAKRCYELGEKLTADETDWHKNVAAAKLISEGTKAIRAACDIRNQRAQREHDRWLVEQRNRMAGGRRGN